MEGKTAFLTWGDLAGTPSTLGNLSSDGQLNSQKSADAIVPSGLRRMGRAEQLRENRTLGIQPSALTKDNRRGMPEGGNGESHGGLQDGGSEAGIKRNPVHAKEV